MPASPEESSPGGALLDSQCKDACPCQPYVAPPHDLADFDTDAELVIDEVEAYSEDTSLSSPIEIIQYPPIKEACSPRQASTTPVASHCETLFSFGEEFPGSASPRSPVVAARAVVQPQTVVLPAPFPTRLLAPAGGVALTAGQTAAVGVSSSSRAHQGGAPGVSTDSNGAIVSILLQADPAVPQRGRPVAPNPGLVAGVPVMTQADSDHVSMGAPTVRSGIRRFHFRSSGSRSVGATPPRSPTSLVTCSTEVERQMRLAALKRFASRQHSVQPYEPTTGLSGQGSPRFPPCSHSAPASPRSRVTSRRAAVRLDFSDGGAGSQVHRRGVSQGLGYSAVMQAPAMPESVVVPAMVAAEAAVQRGEWQQLDRRIVGGSDGQLEGQIPMLSPVRGAAMMRAHRLTPQQLQGQSPSSHAGLSQAVRHLRVPATAPPTQQSPCATRGNSKPSPIRRAAVKLDFGVHLHTEAWSSATVPSKEAAAVSVGQDTTLHLAAVAAQLCSWQLLGGPSEVEALHGLPTPVHQRCSSFSPSRVVRPPVTWSPRVVPESSRVSAHLPSAENRTPATLRSAPNSAKKMAKQGRAAAAQLPPPASSLDGLLMDIINRTHDTVTEVVASNKWADSLRRPPASHQA